MRCWRQILYFLLCIVSITAGAQQNQYPFTRLDITNGISHNQVNAIVKDSKGFIWLGTIAGLNRFDGYGFKIFRHDLRDSSSLGDDGVSQIFEGPGGKLWINTRNGFNIFDPLTEKFDRNPQKFLSHLTIPGGTITNIVKDSKNNYWFIHPTEGIYKFTSSNNTVTHLFHSIHDSTTINSNAIDALAEDSQGNFWLVNSNGVIEKINGRTNKVIFRTYALRTTSNEEPLLFRLLVDAQDELWIFTSNDARGVYYFKPLTGILEHFNKDSRSLKLNTNIIKGLLQDNKGLIWIGTDHGGINVINKTEHSVKYLLNDADDDKSLSQNVITSIYKDNTGIIWVGTYKKGVNYYKENIIKFPLFKHLPSNKNSLSYNDVNRFVEDIKGNIWIGTNGGGLIYFDRGKNKFTQYVHNPNNQNSLTNDVIVSLCIDDQQKLWIGTYFGGMDCFDGNKFTHYQHNPAVPNSIADNRIWEIIEDSKKQLWVGTLGGGLDLLNRATNTFTHYRSTDVNSIRSSIVFTIKEARDGNLWVGTPDGIDVLEKRTCKFIHYAHNGRDSGSLSNNNIMCLLEDSEARMWIATREGLDLFDNKTKKFKTYRIEDGLPDNGILTILEDNKHNLWISTPNGISNIVLTKDSQTGSLQLTCKNYNEADGLQGREFNENAALKTTHGELMFGGANGFNLFNPQNVVTNKDDPSLALTDFQLFNRSVNVNEKIGNRIILSQSISETKELVLKYNQNVFSIEFAALSYTNNEKKKYMYMLEGFNKDWLTVDSKLRKATFTNLDPGNYVFHVRVADEDGNWGKNELTLKIKILPPFWKTPYAYLGYFLLIVTALFLARRLILQRARMKFEIEQEMHEIHRLHELDIMKIKFFTNMSHEFRTPLSLIISPLDKILKTTRDIHQQKQFQLIQRNAKRLLNLVNQLLDFRKLEVQEIKLNPLNGDIIKFIKEISFSFTDIAEKEDIKFSFHSTLDSLYTSFDTDKIERILFNLLSNAFKFTPEHGFISVEVDQKYLEDNHANKGELLLEIRVKDSGIGIPADKQEKIFERFFQNDIPGSMVNQGSGIGLAITKEFVKLHGGTITVESEPEKGSCFIVLLPVVKINHSIAENEKIEIHEEMEIKNEIVLAKADQPIPLSKNKLNSSKKATLLLIEDNVDFLFYLKDNLREYYTIAEASNGREGWQKVLQVHPDLVVSDINMPEMNGIDLCKKIKSDPRTAYLPVILLTARTGDDQLIEGYETGANDYITKPFNFEILLSRIKNMLSQQESLRKSYQKQVEVVPSEIKVVSENEKFIQLALDIVEKNMDNTEFSVEEMSRELYISRVSLYKKLFSVTGKTPLEFIRSIRLKRAAQLLEQSQMTISEVAYEVGFNNPKYFAKYFKAEFGILPSAYLQGKRGSHAADAS
jgi:signal transduction histidine kinase/ligand-binding sensor domain-containing protein/DNA-binding response OmpR family regulator